MVALLEVQHEEYTCCLGWPVCSQSNPNKFELEYLLKECKLI